MKLAKMMGAGGVAMLSAAVLLAQAEERKTIKVVGLEDDKDNATVVAPAELGTKPTTITVNADAVVNKARESAAAEAPVVQKREPPAAKIETPVVKPAEPVAATPPAPVAKPTVSITADALATGAAESAPAGTAKVDAANIKSLTVEGMVIPPSAEAVKTLEEAVRNILVQAGKQVGTVSSNGIEKLVMPYQQLGDGKSYEVEWRKALRLLLSPVGYNFTEDSELVLFGLAGEVDAKHLELARERLAANRTPILFTTNESEGGMELRSAIRDVSVKAGVTITTDYMVPADLYVPAAATSVEGKLSADDIGKAKEKSAARQVQVKRTTFDTNGQQVEWRIVLREILNPFDYDFVEVGGVVRIAKREQLAKWELDAVAKKPLSAKVIRLYHADPEAVVERLKAIKGLLRHPNASLQATRKKEDSTETVKNLNARIQTGSGQRSGMSDTTSQVFDKLIRPRTVPAIIAYDVEENIAEIEAKVKLFDIKEKQILIEAIIFQLDTDNGTGDMDGIFWSGFEDVTAMYGSFGNVGALAATYPDMVETVEKTVTQMVPSGTSAGTDAQGRPTTSLTYTPVTSTRLVNKSRGMFDLRDGKRVWMKSGYLDFRATIQMIRERSNSKLLSSPSIVVGDHSEAAIQVSDVDPVPQIEASALSSGDNLQENMNIQWNMVRSGVLMWVSPEITEKGSSVRLTVHPQVVSKGARVDLKELGGKFAEYPVYNYELKMHEMDTRATVPSGATLLFGGLIDNVEEEFENKVRWLGDLPVIGWLFRSKTKTLVQKNLVIMIRPTILEDVDQTGFETNALKEAKSVMVNSGRDLKSTPIGGPYSWEETKKNVKDFVDERVVKPFEAKKPEDSEKTEPAPPESAPAEPVSDDRLSALAPSATGESAPVPADAKPPETPAAQSGDKPGKKADVQ